MKNLFRNFILVGMIMVVACLWGSEARGVEVFVNGEEFSSPKDYRQTRVMAELAADRSGIQLKLKGTSVQTKTKTLPFDFDPTKGRTVVIASDGTLKEEKGVSAPLDWMEYDPDKGKTIQLRPLAPSDEGVMEEGGRGLVSTGGEDPDVVDHGRIAGVQPPLAEIVKQFQAARGNLAAVKVSSSYELEEGLRKALQGAEGVVLVIAGSGKVRLYDLRGSLPARNTPDGQKTR